jgi:anti-sigma factor RsiW
MEQDHCRELLDGLSAYIEGEASADLCAELERHLAECGDCRVVVDTLRQTIRLYRNLPPPAFPFEARERLYQSLELARFVHPNSP